VDPRVLLVVVIVLLVVLVAMAGGLLQVGERADTDTKGYDVCVDTPFVKIELRGFGQFGDPASDSVKRGEVYSGTRLWYAWFKDGESRPVTVEARLKDCEQISGPGILAIDHVYYVFSIDNGDGRGFTGFVNDRLPASVHARELNIPSGAIDIALGSFSLIVGGFQYKPCDIAGRLSCEPSSSQGWVTIRDGAVLKVDVHVERRGFPAYGPVLVATDQINLRSAIPEVTWSSRAYEIGDTAVANWEIPVVNDEAGNAAYFLTILDMNTNTPIAGWNRRPLTSETGQARIPVTSAMFSNDAATCQNQLRAVIHSQLIQADLESTAIQAPFDAAIGVGDPPEVTRLTFDRAEYFEGDPVTISYAGTGTITKWHVTAHIAGLVVYDKDTSATEVSFTAPASGFLEVQVTAYNGCQPSEVRKETATVGEVLPDYCQAFPEHPACKDVTNDAALASLILGIVLAVGGFLIFLYLGPRHIVFVIVGLLVTFAGVLLIAFAIVEIVTRSVPFI
jgi:hypothetical protein